MFEILAKYDLQIFTTEDGVSVIAWDELRKKLGAKEFDQFKRWMRGQTCIAEGAFVDDVERFLMKWPVID